MEILNNVWLIWILLIVQSCSKLPEQMQNSKNFDEEWTEQWMVKPKYISHSSRITYVNERKSKAEAEWGDPVEMVPVTKVVFHYGPKIEVEGNPTEVLIYRFKMGNRYVFVNNDNIVAIYEEWSDF